MTHDANTTVINVKVAHDGGQLYASSDDIFGLNVTAANESELCERVVAGVKWLFKQNKKMDVDVIIPSAPSDFPHIGHRSCAQLVIAAA